MKIDLIRHGKTYGNTLSRYIGRTDEPLLESWTEELKKRTYPQVERVYVSPLLRCRQTAQILYPQMEKQIIEGLAECDFGLFENKNYKEMTGDPLYQAWIDSGGNMTFPEGENPLEFRKRSVKTFEKLWRQCEKDQVEQCAIVAHGGTIMSIMERFCLPKQEFYKWYVGNGEGYELEMDNRGCSSWIPLGSYTG